MWMINEAISMKDTEIESILDLNDDDIVPVVEETVVKEDKSLFSQDNKSLDLLKNNKIPKLMGDNYPKEFMCLVERLEAQYRLLPLIEYELIYTEISDLNVKGESTPTLQQISLELQKVQAAQERLSEICLQIIRAHTLKKRALDILKEAWGSFSTEKSADKRKGDALFRMSDFEADFLETDCLYKTLLQVSKNLDSKFDNLSRRITIAGLQLKVNDSRGFVQDYDFESLKNDDGTFGSLSYKNKEGNEPVDPTEGVEPDEMQF